MNDFHADSVGILKKSIYVIENDINDKKYIGQSKNPQERFKTHCKKSANSLLSEDILKYGKEHFFLKILEEDVENYDEREKYWIEKLGTLTPHGYNIEKGGSAPPIHFGESSPVSSISDIIVKQIQMDLINTRMSYSKISNKYEVSKRTILRINSGEQRRDDCLDYPLRKESNINGKLTKQQVIEIIDKLKHTYLFSGEIGELYNVDCHTINNINKGILHKIEGENYPIRKWKSCGEKSPVTYEQVSEIYDLLKDSNLSFREIAKRYNLKLNFIMGLNRGTFKKYKRDNVLYPIRPIK